MSIYKRHKATVNVIGAKGFIVSSKTYSTTKLARDIARDHMESMGLDRNKVSRFEGRGVNVWYGEYISQEYNYSLWVKIEN